MVNESDVIKNIKDSVGILSDETLVAQHPWVDDPAEEMERLKKQKEEEVNLYGDFGKGDPNANNPDGNANNPDDKDPDAKEGDSE